MEGYDHTGICIEENIIFLIFCCCFKLGKKIEKLSNEQLTRHCQMHTDWPSATG